MRRNADAMSACQHANAILAFVKWRNKSNTPISCYLPVTTDQRVLVKECFEIFAEQDMEDERDRRECKIEIKNERHKRKAIDDGQARGSG